MKIVLAFVFIIEGILASSEESTQANSNQNIGENEQPLLWANDNYSLVKSRGPCPAGFSDRNKLKIKHDKIVILGSDILDGTKTSESSYELKKCVKKIEGKDKTTELPKGSYCVLLDGENCPKNLKYTRIEITDVYMTGSKANSELLAMCCSKTASENDETELLFPIDNSFILIKNGKKCPTVKGIEVSEHHIEIISKVHKFVKSESSHPIVPANPNSIETVEFLKIELCFYEKTRSKKSNWSRADLGFGIVVLVGIMAGLTILMALVLPRTQIKTIGLDN